MDKILTITALVLGQRTTYYTLWRINVPYTVQRINWYWVRESNPLLSFVRATL